ncbi:Uncharacterised protein [BD1-7 clade bacterium]|uniref:Zinc/iron-chelating domain-containing protein n=1 Tax=BD1-7 clade bacterium TaxID=2029982 RepID=A0A5S9QPS4_9GAMM|nr:Uncharacterised protein [BD1-7 clade bacterium]CAA0121297.1 Uncharacterised protein [BD1-7 clade bacterium]
MECREGCGACCIAPSIKAPYLGMPDGKKAGEPCVHLDEQMRCLIFEDPRRPTCCAAFQAEEWLCSDSRHIALENITELEQASCGRRT